MCKHFMEVSGAHGLAAVKESGKQWAGGPVKPYRPPSECLGNLRVPSAKCPVLDETHQMGMLAHNKS